MRAKNINTAHIEGRVYQHSLALKTVQNQQSANFGKQFINGTIEIAVDEAGMEVIPVEYVYVTETTSKGGQNKTYAALLNIIQNGKTVMADGMEAATKVSIDTATDLNDFVAQDGSMVSQQIFNGGFVEIVGNLKPEGQRTSFKTDIVITNISHIDADAEKMIDADYTTVRGVIFNFRNAILPVEFVVKNPLGMGYFESLEVSNAAPLFTTVWGNLNFVPKAVQRVEESAFGEAAVLLDTLGIDADNLVRALICAVGGSLLLGEKLQALFELMKFLMERLLTRLRLGNRFGSLLNRLLYLLAVRGVLFENKIEVMYLLPRNVNV